MSVKPLSQSELLESNCKRVQVYSCACAPQVWIAYQLLHALAFIDEKGLVHGDLKCENVLVTSWNWVYLADFASYKPTRLPADNPVRSELHLLSNV